MLKMLLMPQHKKISVKSKFELLSVSKHGSECTPEGVRRSLNFNDYVCQACQHYRRETLPVN